MKAFVGVTDFDWFRFLRSRPSLEEVNFWQPSGSSRFGAIEPGELFLFKLHSPRNFVVGGGFFAHFSLLPHRTAWDFFGESNGAQSFNEMERRIAKYRKVAPDPRSSFVIGCILLSNPFFFEEPEWIPVPPDWKPNIVRGKTYDLRSGFGAGLYEKVQLRLQAGGVRERPAATEGSLYGEPALIRPRLGQGTFKTMVADTYDRHCAVTGEKALPALDAAHVRAVSEGGRHTIDNGVLLRSDVHRLFDAGYVAVTPDYRFRVSRRLKDDFDNGEPYYPLEGSEIWLPGDPTARPNKEFLEEHYETRFRG